jgi:predicted nucleic acid-binding protein
VSAINAINTSAFIAYKALFQELPLLEPTPGFWERAGLLRASIVARRHKARLADTLIAQTCIDHGVPLVTRDLDFRHFVGAGLTLL